MTQLNTTREALTEAGGNSGQLLVTAVPRQQLVAPAPGRPPSAPPLLMHVGGGQVSASEHSHLIGPDLSDPPVFSRSLKRGVKGGSG